MALDLYGKGKGQEQISTQQGEHEATHIVCRALRIAWGGIGCIDIRHIIRPRDTRRNGISTRADATQHREWQHATPSHSEPRVQRLIANNRYREKYPRNRDDDNRDESRTQPRFRPRRSTPRHRDDGEAQSPAGSSKHKPAQATIWQYSFSFRVQRYGFCKTRQIPIIWYLSGSA